MIKVVYTHKVSGEKQESQFGSLEELNAHKEQHPEMYSDFDFVEDDNTEVVEQIKKVSSRKEIREMCAGLLDEIGVINSSAQDATMDAIFLNPSFVAIGLALLAGAPKSAKRYILQVGPSLYPQDKVDSLCLKLDAIIASEGV